MYRYTVDNSVTYTPEDMVLFRESPFAVWMERLTLENPDHGIPADFDSIASREDVIPQDEIVETLRAEGRDVALIDWDIEESRRRADTMDAMRSGADFVVNGLLVAEPLCGNVNLLMRTSGYSNLGDFLYVPCDTQAETTSQSAFRLCFLADLLNDLQGQLPPQMLLIRGDADVVPLHTEDHIYYYRAVKKRFMEAMHGFRKHRMPDPTESAHFGRWSECASEVLKQRAQSADYLIDEAESIAEEAEQAEQAVMPRMQRMAQGAGGSIALDASLGQASIGMPIEALDVAAPTVRSAPTLAEQASMLSPDAFKMTQGPGHTPNLARFPRAVENPPPQEPQSTQSLSPKDAPELNIVATADHARSVQKETVDGAVEATEVTADEIAQAPGESLRDESLESRLAETTGDSVESKIEAWADEWAEKWAEDGVGEQSEQLAGDQHDDQHSEATGLREENAPVYDALQNLAFIGSAQTALRGGAKEPCDVKDKIPAIHVEHAEHVEEDEELALRQAPPPNLRELTDTEPKIEGYEVELIELESFARELQEPLLLPPEEASGGYAKASQEPGRRDDDFYHSTDSIVDLDSAPPPTLKPVLPESADEPSNGLFDDFSDKLSKRLSEETVDPLVEDEPAEELSDHDSAPGKLHSRQALRDQQEWKKTPVAPGFSSSLITNEDFDGAP